MGILVYYLYQHDLNLIINNYNMKQVKHIIYL